MELTIWLIGEFVLGGSSIQLGFPNLGAQELFAR